MWRALLLPAGLGPMLGCASLQGLSGGSPEGGADAGIEARADAGDAALDVPGDTASARDGAEAGDAAAASFCASLVPQPSFCDDFDEGRMLADDWTKLEIFPPNAGTLSTDPSASFSAPASLAASVGPGTSSSAGLIAYVQRVLATPATSRAHLQYEIHLDSADMNESVEVSQLAFGGGTGIGPYIIDLFFGPSGAVLQEEIPTDGPTTFRQYPLAVQPGMGTWSLVDLVVDFANVTMTVTVDGAPAVQRALDPGYQTGSVSLNLGTGYYSSGFVPVARGAAHLDNVVLDVR